jgi:hypothetical protein
MAGPVETSAQYSPCPRSWGRNGMPSTWNGVRSRSRLGGSHLMGTAAEPMSPNPRPLRGPCRWRRSSPGTVARLRSLRARQAADRLGLALRGTQGTRLVLVDPLGKPVRPELFSGRFQRLSSRPDCG